MGSHQLITVPDNNWIIITSNNPLEGGRGGADFHIWLFHTNPDYCEDIVT